MHSTLKIKNSKLSELTPMKTSVKYFSLASLLLAAMLVGCSGDLEKKVAELQKRNAELAQDSATKTAYIEDVTRAINSVQSNIDSIEIKAAAVRRTSSDVEKSGGTQKLTDDFSAINAYLRDNAQKINDLQAKLKSSRVKIKGLETMVATLTKTVAEKEKQILDLQQEVTRLNGEVAFKGEEIKRKDDQLKAKDDQIGGYRKEINTVYYIVGTKDDLVKKGIVESKGGFLGIGRKTLLQKDFDLTKLTNADLTTLSEIPINRDPDSIEIITPHASDSYSLEKSGKNQTTLKIKSAQSFWQKSKSLVILID
jgi:cell division protein FtsB